MIGNASASILGEFLRTVVLTKQEMSAEVFIHILHFDKILAVGTQKKSYLNR